MQGVPASPVKTKNKEEVKLEEDATKPATNYKATPTKAVALEDAVANQIVVIEKKNLIPSSQNPNDMSLSNINS